MKSIKKILPRSSFVDTLIYGTKYNAPDLVALILKDLKAKADAYTGYNCTRAVVGRPAFFDDANPAKDQLAQQRLKKAVNQAGFEDVRFQFEPIGAAFAYEKTITRSETVLVADLGGGTTDFTVIKLDPEKVGRADRKDDIVATGGIYIGGDSFDSAFMWDKGTPYFGRMEKYESMPGKFLDLPMSYFTNICSWDKMNFFNGYKIKNELNKYYIYTKNSPLLKNLITLTDHNLGFQVFQAIEKVKTDLSRADSTLFSYDNLGIHIAETIPLATYNTVIQNDITKISNYLDAFMLTKNIRMQDIDSLFLTGGTSLVRSIQNLFKTKFPNVIHKIRRQLHQRSQRPGL